MKHIKLFEEFSQSGPEKILIGYYGEGGYGSHPGILTKEMYDKFEENQSLKHPRYKSFDITQELDYVPDYLACYLDDDRGWQIVGVSKSQVSKFNKDIEGSEIDKDNPRFKEIANSLGIEVDNTDIKYLYIIPVEGVNKIYWSDAPESTHGYWEPYTSHEMSMEEFFDDTDEKSDLYYRYSKKGSNSFALPADSYGNSSTVIELGSNKSENLSKLNDRLKIMDDFIKNQTRSSNPQYSMFPINHDAVKNLLKIAEDGDVLFFTRGGQGEIADINIRNKKTCAVLADNNMEIKKAIWSDGSKVSDSDMAALEVMMTSPFWDQYKK